MLRMFKSLTFTDAVFGAVTAILLVMNVYYLYSPHTYVARSRELKQSIDTLRDESEACEEAINKAFGRKLYWYRDDKGVFHSTYWD